MYRTAFFFVLLSTAGAAQNNLNNLPVNNNPPPVQQVMNNPVNQGNVSNWDVNQDDNNDIQTNKQNDFEQFQINGEQQDNTPQKKEPCNDCAEIKKLKQQHYSPSYTPGSAKKHHFRKMCNKTNKQMKKWFSKSKKKRPDYSCFNW